MNFPPILYKYRSVEDALRVLDDHRVKISSARVFNDPFELSPIFTGQIERATLLNLILQPSAIEVLYRQNNPPMSLADYTAFFHQNADAIFQGFNQNSNRAYAQSLFEESAAKDFPMHCLSQPPDDVLMWAHYADCHEGVVLGISTEGWGTNPRAFLPVRYRCERPVININDILSTSNPSRCADAYINAFTTKSKHWAYESEFRCFFPANDPQITSLDKDGSKLLFWPLSASRIREIIFGCRCTPESRASIANAAVKAGCAKIQFRAAVLHPTAFALRLDDMPDQRFS